MKYSVVFFLLISAPFLSQNLILNPSFEDVEQCAEHIGGFSNNVINWSTPSFGTTDLFNICEQGVVGIPNNYNGKQHPKSGANYAGMYVYSDDNYREYIQGQLSEPLEKGITYTVSFYVSLAEKSDFAIKNIGFLLSHKQLKTQLDRELSQRQLNKSNIQKYTFYDLIPDRFYDNTSSWIMVSLEIVAKGGEQYLTIGNFNKNSKTEKTKVSNKNRYNMSYYYIDKVSLKRTIPILEKQEESIVTEVEERIKLDKEYTFKHIVFEFNSTLLSEEAKQEIALVYHRIQEVAKATIIISGHTDNVGSSIFNQGLSERRAAAVAAYFKTLGLAEHRIEAIGYGDTQPIKTNNNEEGRHQNRRVTFKILQE